MREQERREILAILGRFASEAVAEWVIRTAANTMPADAVVGEAMPHVLKAAEPVLDATAFAGLRNALDALPAGDSATRTLTITCLRDVRRARMVARTLALELGMAELTVLGLVGAVTDVGQRALSVGATGTIRLEALRHPVRRVRVTSYMVSPDSLRLITKVTEHGPRGDTAWDSFRNAAAFDVQVDGDHVRFVFELAD